LKKKIRYKNCIFLNQKHTQLLKITLQQQIKQKKITKFFIPTKNIQNQQIKEFIIIAK